MQIKTSYSKLASLLNLMNLVISKKGLSDDYKVVNLFVQDDKLYALSTDTSLYCLDVLEGEYDLEGEDNPFMVITIKEISDVLSKYTSLQRTEVKEIVLNTQQKGIVMTVVEEPKDIKGGFNFSDMYKGQTTRYKLNNQRVKPVIMRELPTIVVPPDSTEMQSKTLQKYLDYMYPPMTKPKDPAVLNFKDEFVCSIMGNLYGISMENNLPHDIFTDMSWSLHVMNFLRNILPMQDTFKIYKEVNIPKSNHNDDDDTESGGQKLITLLIESGSTIIKLKAKDTTESVNSSVFKSVGLNSIEVDKPYFVDSLRRLDGFDQVFVEIKITEDENVVGSSKGEMILKTVRTCQRIPIKCANGSGEFKFMLKPESLGLMAFTHLTKDMNGNTDKINDLIFFMDGELNNPVNLTCRDKSEEWQTRYPRAPFREAPQLDF